jgi:beta-glucosidase
MPLEGIKKAAKERDIEVLFTKGWNHQTPKDNLELPPGADEMIGRLREGPLAAFVPDYFLETMKEKRGERRWKTDDEEAGLTDEELLTRTLKLAKEADTVIVIAGTDLSTCREDYDRATTELPYNQNEIIRKIIKINRRTIVCAVTCGPVTGSFISETPALLACYYPGQSQGDAIADVLFGKYNPNGRITETWYKSDDDLPPMYEYGLRKEDTANGKGRTYQFFSEEPLFPFGHGLSYTKFSYSNININKNDFTVGETISLSVDVTNTGEFDGAEILELYIAKENQPHTYDNKPVKQLKAFQKVFLLRGETKTAVLTVPVKEINFWSNAQKCFVVENGDYTISLGKSSADGDVIHQGKIGISGTWKREIKHIVMYPEKHIMRQKDSITTKTVVVFDDYSKSEGAAMQVFYRSSNEQTATVDNLGKVTAIGRGVATITASIIRDDVLTEESIAVAVV